MGIGTLYSVPKNPAELSAWTFANAAHHRDIARVIYQTRNHAVVPQYVIDPLDPSDEGHLGTWLYQHQVMHNRQNAILGISGYDLDSVDWRDDDALARWIAHHADEHAQAGRILNIG